MFGVSYLVPGINLFSILSCCCIMKHQTLNTRKMSALKMFYEAVKNFKDITDGFHK